MKKQTFLCGIFILALGTLFAKIIGAIYRIPLTWMLGVEGLGIYQLVYPIFSLLIIISSTGASTAISAMVSERIKQNNLVEAHKIFRLSAISLTIIGLLFAFLLIALSSIISNIQGNALATLPYIAISLAIPFVAILSAYRGYYQGCQNMLPTAISQIIEQLGKLVFGLILGSVLLPMGIQYGVVGAFLGVVIGEIVSVLILFIYSYFKKRKIKFTPPTYNQPILTNKMLLIELFKRTTPILLASLLLPLIQVLDSLLVVNLLSGAGFDTNQSTSIWGIYSGVVTSIINLPIILSLSICTSIVPEITTTSSTIDKPKITKAFNLTLNIAIPSMFAIMILAPSIITLLYGNTFDSLLVDELTLSINLLVLSSFIIPLLSIMQIQNATLQGLNKSTIPLYNILLSSVLKILLVVILVKIPSIYIYGFLIANITFYLSAVILNQYYINKRLKVSQSFGNIFPVLISTSIMSMVLLVSRFAFVNFSLYLSLPLQVIIGLITYFSTLLVTDKQLFASFPIQNLLCRVYKK